MAPMMKLFYNPVSSYSQKVLMALHEKDAPFEPQVVNLMDRAARAAYEECVNVFGKLPTLVLSNGTTIPESSIIIEYLDAHVSTGTKLIPDDRDLARQCRSLDRMADLYLNDPMQTVFFDGMKPEADREPRRVASAKKTLDKMYKFMNEHFAKKTWALGDAFSMADVAAAPCLNYLRMVYPFDAHGNVVAYATRCTERPSFQRVMAEAGPALATAFKRN
jgi:glutathione S-transferase